MNPLGIKECACPSLERKTSDGCICGRYPPIDGFRVLPSGLAPGYLVSGEKAQHDGGGLSTADCYWDPYNGLWVTKQYAFDNRIFEQERIRRLNQIYDSNGPGKIDGPDEHKKEQMNLTRSTLFPSYNWDEENLRYRRDGTNTPFEVGVGSALYESEHDGYLTGEVIQKNDWAERGGWITNYPTNHSNYRSFITWANSQEVIKYRCYVSRHRREAGYGDWIWDPHRSEWLNWTRFRDRYLAGYGDRVSRELAMARDQIDPDNYLNPKSTGYDPCRHSNHVNTNNNENKENCMSCTNCQHVCGCGGGSTDPFVITRMRLDNEIAAAETTRDRLDHFAGMDEPGGTIRWTRNDSQYFANKNGAHWDVFCNNRHSQSQVTWAKLVTEFLICADDVELASYAKAEPASSGVSSDQTTTQSTQ